MKIFIIILFYLIQLCCYGQIELLGINNSTISGNVGVYGAVSNYVSSASSLSFPVLPNGGNNALYIVDVAWYAVTFSAITNNLGVAGTPLCTNDWAGAIANNDAEVTFYWANTTMTNAYVIFTSAAGQVSAQMVELTNAPNAPPYISTSITNYYATSSTATLTNIVSSALNNIVINFSTRNAIAADVPTFGGSPIATLIGSMGASGWHYTAAAWQQGATTVTNTVSWTGGGSTFSSTTLSVP